MSVRFGQDFDVGCWCLVEVTKLNLGQDSEARYGQDFKFKFSRDTDVWDLEVNT